MRWRAALRCVAILLNSLSFLAPDLLAGITDTFALIGLGRVEAANIRRHLADEFLIDAGDRELRLIDHCYFYLFWNREENWMRKTEAEIEIGSLHGGFESDAFDLELLGETL